MLARNGRLKIAIQKDGRITDDSINLLKATGLDFDFRPRSLFSPCRNFSLDMLSIRDDDIPEYVQDGVCDLGIVGENVLVEKRARVSIVEHLGFGKCRLVICVPSAGKIHRLSQLKGKRIATSYPLTIKRFLGVRSISAEVIEISGAVEITPALDVADATCDIISTGSTARINGLKVIHTILDSEAVLISKASALRSRGTKALIDQLLTRFRSVLSARAKKYVMMNAPAAAVEKIRKLIPALKSPTVMPLAEPSLVAIHSVVPEERLWDVIENLKQAGATDIVVVPIEKMIA